MCIQKSLFVKFRETIHASWAQQRHCSKVARIQYIYSIDRLAMDMCSELYRKSTNIIVISSIVAIKWQWRALKSDHSSQLCESTYSTSYCGSAYSTSYCGSASAFMRIQIQGFWKNKFLVQSISGNIRYFTLFIKVAFHSIKFEEMILNLNLKKKNSFVY